MCNHQVINDISNLSMALQVGHTDAVKRYVEAILNSTLASDQKIELLTAKTVDGIPGLWISLQKGNTEIITIYLEAILNSTLEPSQKLELIALNTGIY
ncbi:MAG: hypothetical protein NXI01_01280 [Gammaproteobacteria bacterium]|nr:hypothetical protein [Gammaproteobacteria bacterium]